MLDNQELASVRLFVIFWSPVELVEATVQQLDFVSCFFLAELLAEVIKHKPADPVTYLIEYLSRSTRK